MNDELVDEIEALVNQQLPQSVRDYLDRPYTPAKLVEVEALLNVAAKLVETAAYGSAGKVREKTMIDLFALSSQLETQARVVGGLQVS